MLGLAMGAAMRVLICSAPGGYPGASGAGHTRAAEAVLSAFARYHPEVKAEHLDVLKLVPPAFRRAYADGYLHVLESLPSTWGWLYAKSDRLPAQSALASVRKFIRRMDAKDILACVARRRPDVILATHFLPAAILAGSSHRRPAGGMAAPKLAVLVTGHDVHPLWVQRHVDRYYAGAEEIAYQLAEREVDPRLIKTTGIPCDPVFGELIDEPARQRLRRLLGLSGAPAPRLLLNAQSCGALSLAAVKGLAGVINHVLANGAPKTILVVCGHNEKIRNALASRIRVPARCLVHIYGAVTNLHELLGIADLAVTKPAGLSTSECLARCVPMVLVCPVPGQEERQAEMLLENGCAVLARTLVALCCKLDMLLNDPQRLAGMREGCRRLGRPQAAANIAADVVELCSRNGVSRLLTEGAR